MNTVPLPWISSRAASILASVTIAVTAAGCNDNDMTTTIITTVSGDPSPSSHPDPTSSDPTDGASTDEGGTTSLGDTSGDPSASTTAGSESSSADGDASTGSDDHACWPETMPEACGADGDCDVLFACDMGSCSCGAVAAKGADFCSVVRVLAIDAGVTEPYLQFVADMCTSGEDRCVVCFNLQNYCDLLAGQCDNLYTACGCVGDFYGTP